MILFCLYALLLISIGLFDARKHSSIAAFFVNARQSGSVHTGISIVASCIGGSATVGMAGLAWQAGTPAFWWIGSGACGLLILTLFLAKKVRETGAHTMPELATVFLGSPARHLISLLIVPAWLAILAAQLTVMGKLTANLTGLPPELSLVTGTALIVLYALLGGQASVIRSDLPQYLLMLSGLILTLGWLLLKNPLPVLHLSPELFNSRFPLSDLSHFMIILGGSYVVCPMLFGRILSAQNTQSAVAGCRLAIVGLVLTAIVIVLIGISCRGFVPPETAPDDVLPVTLSLLPEWTSTVLLLALLSAVLSSADSCLITLSTVICHDLLQRDNVSICRITTLMAGVGGYFLATREHGVLDLLLMANDVYVCGVVTPLFCAMLICGRRHVRSGTGLAAILCGGMGGLASVFLEQPEIGYIGMVLSAFCILGGSVSYKDRQPVQVAAPSK